MILDILIEFLKSCYTSLALDVDSTQELLKHGRIDVAPTPRCAVLLSPEFGATGYFLVNRQHLVNVSRVANGWRLKLVK